MRFNASLVTCCAAVAGLVSAIALGAETPTRGWMSDFNKAEAEAKRLGVPLVIHFYADWCGPCRQMEADVLHRPEVLAELGTRSIGVKVNSDHRGDVVTRFGISALPSDVIVGPDGKVLVQTTGMQERANYVARIAGYGNQYARLRPGVNQPQSPVVPAAVAQNPGDTEKDEPVGLQGYSPVALTQHKTWSAGRQEFSWLHEGIEYRMASTEEFELFKQNPGRYAPQFLGCDPMILATTQRSVSGNIKYGAYWRGALYLFYSEDNRSHFLQEPQKYAEADHQIQVEKIELLSAR